MTTEHDDEDSHGSAAKLLVSAAEQAGLLQTIAEALRYADAHGQGSRLADALRTALTDAFVINIMRDDDPLVGGALEIFYGEDFVMSDVYLSGDPYLEIAKLARTVPPGATEKTRGPQRELSKARALATTYGSGNTTRKGNTYHG